MRNMNATAQQNRRRRTSPNMVKLLKPDGGVVKRNLGFFV